MRVLPKAMTRPSYAQCTTCPQGNSPGAVVGSTMLRSRDPGGYARFIVEILMQDPDDLCDRLRMGVHVMSGFDHKGRGSAWNDRTGQWHNAITFGRMRRQTPRDRVIGNAGYRQEPLAGPPDGLCSLQCRDARDPAALVAGKDLGPDDLRVRAGDATERLDLLWRAAREAFHETRVPPVCERASLMRGGEVDRTGDPGVGREHEETLDRSDVGRIARNGFRWHRECR